MPIESKIVGFLNFLAITVIIHLYLKARRAALKRPRYGLAADIAFLKQMERANRE